MPRVRAMFRHRERFVKFLIFFVVGSMVISLVAGVLLTLFGNG
jgi:hypothetical protein